MVVDEELKMMCDICHEGGQVLGPFLKPMTHLVHTEYLLAGRTRSDVRDVLRDTMFAATVTGAPVENACRLIHAYESEGRGYYAGALALIGRDADGAPTADSPIVIRTADVSPSGAMKVTAGATLVRDSNPEHEVAETLAKAGGILSAFGLVPGATGAPSDIADLTQDEDVLIALNSRNQRLAKFWLTDQAGAPPAPSLAGKTIAILHGEDDFVNMLAHVFSVLGMGSRVIRHETLLEHGAEGVFDDVDLVVVGPGPGDPREHEHPKIAAYRLAIDSLLASGKPFLAVCLGHQVLCDTLGIPLAYKDIVFQGTQSAVGIAGREERVGFYNTFVARVAGGRSPGRPPPGVRPGDRRRPPRGRTDLPRRAVPRRVDPHRERLRAAARPAAGAVGVSLPVVAERAQSRAAPDHLRVLVVDHYDSYTWNLVHLVAAVTGTLPEVVEHDAPGVLDLGSLRHARRALTRTRPPRGPCRLRARAGRVRPRGAGAGRLPRDAGPGHGVRRDGGAGRAGTRRGRIGAPRREWASSRACRRRSRRCATTRWPRPRCPTSSR